MRKASQRSKGKSQKAKVVGRCTGFFRTCRRSHSSLLPFAFCLLTFDLPFTSAEPKYDVRLHYQKSEYDIPMRDGVRLHTTVYMPHAITENLSFLLLRTPYGTCAYWS